MGLFRPADAGRAPGSTGRPGLADVIICLAAVGSTGAAVCDSCAGTGPAEGVEGTVAWRCAVPGRPDDVPGLAALLPMGICGRPAAVMHMCKAVSWNVGTPQAWCKCLQP